MQKNRWPFFFLEGLFVSLVALSLSDPSPPSSMLALAESTELVDLCEPDRSKDPFMALAPRSAADEELERFCGSGIVLKLSRVGVLTVD